LGFEESAEGVGRGRGVQFQHPEKEGTIGEERTDRWALSVRERKREAAGVLAGLVRWAIWLRAGPVEQSSLFLFCFFFYFLNCFIPFSI
jgi:hypothetical protein